MDFEKKPVEIGWIMSELARRFRAGSSRHLKQSHKLVSSNTRLSDKRFSVRF